MKHQRLQTHIADLRPTEVGMGPIARASIAILLAASVAIPSFALAQQATTSPSTATSSTGPATATMTESEKKALAALEREGYTQVRDLKSGPEVTSAKAVKDGKEVSVIVDSSGKVKQQY